MSELIKMTCRCGAMFETTCNAYILPGGGIDAEGRKYLAEIRAQNWLDAHAACLIRIAEKEPTDWR